MTTPLWHECGVRRISLYEAGNGLPIGVIGEACEIEDDAGSLLTKSTISGSAVPSRNLTGGMRTSSSWRFFGGSTPSTLHRFAQSSSPSVARRMRVRYGSRRRDQAVGLHLEPVLALAKTVPLRNAPAGLKPIERQSYSDSATARAAIETGLRYPLKSFRWT